MLLIFPRVSVECGQIQVGRCLGYIEIMMIGLEEVVNDERGPIEEHAGDLVGVGDEGVAAHDAVEDQAGVGQSADGESVGGHRPRVGRVGRPEVGIHDVLHSVISPSPSPALP